VTEVANFEKAKGESW